MVLLVDGGLTYHGLKPLLFKRRQMLLGVPNLLISILEAREQ